MEPESEDKKVQKRAAFIFKAWRRAAKNPLVIFSFIVLFILFFMAFSAPFIAPHDPKLIYWDSVSDPPSWEFPLGTDATGRCIYSRILWGARVSLLIGLGAVTISSLIGVSLGAIAGYFGGWIDNILMRFTEIVMMIPSLFFAMLITSVFRVTGSGIIMGIIGFLGWGGIARVVRSQVLTLKERSYIEASKSMGESDFNMLFGEILPNSITAIIIMITMRMGRAILIESSLSFLGLGDPKTITWGRMLSTGYGSLDVSWWIATFPGLAIFITVLGFNLLGDGLRDAFDVRI